MVLTNFFNWAQPFIRYRTGDFGTIQKQSCICEFTGPTLVELHGREATQFAGTDRCVDPRTLNAPLTRLPIKHFTVTQQEEGQFEVTWRPVNPEVSSEEIKVAITNIIRESLGEVSVTIARLQPLASPAPKARRYVNQPESR